MAEAEAPTTRAGRPRIDRAARRAAAAPGGGGTAGTAGAGRKIPYFDLLDEAGLQRIERQANRLLEQVGLEFRDDAEALRIWRAAGAEVAGVRVRLPGGLARRLCALAPERFVQHARNPARSVTIGGPNTVFAPAYGSPFVRCLEQGRRYGTLADFENFVKLAWRLPWLHHSGGTVCEPCDQPVNKRHLDMLYAHLRWSDKPFLGSITALERAEDTIEMARLAFGAGFLEAHCVVLGNVNVNSPLMYDKVATEAMRVYAAANQGILVVPFILGGAMGPVTTAGALAQALAEAMAGVAFCQAVRPGAPVVLGSFLSSMSLRSGAPTFGMPEPVLSNYAVGQLARRLRLPLRCGGALTASKIPDAQAAYESADSLHSTVLGGANYVLHAAGWLESGLTMGYEKLVLDADRLGAMQVLLKGFPTDDNGLAVEAYDEVAPGGHFLGCSHTLANYETAFYDARLSDSESVEQWEEQGSKDAATRALARWKALLADYEPPPIDPGVDEALRDFVARRKAAVPDAWH
ncbi:trimethylamine---corrinoid protein Co-methyltransferase [Tistlia consotensis]|uniref:Methyltransferase n=1 Tax=Tistlia consotensis USBA 355 TaxID=560819 RepID=A0A1Y6CG96_9PROT|nr:trimethylamine methyltransferase family protein [Tistlia consotensis]SMF54044.1 trimethylamine---corrinoid protein Co-methyltransferase [Tistlia consotensis USBA 355]SNR86478.1 trimethylamine---corrinoid protein Co-methyltransferase [Tistlia consotensis]